MRFTGKNACATIEKIHNVQLNLVLQRNQRSHHTLQNYVFLLIFHVSIARTMNIFQRFVYTLNRPVAWKRSSHENTDQWKAIRVGDVVEAAVENPSNMRYRVEEILPEGTHARVVRIGANNEEFERYTLAMVMLRPLATTGKKK